MAAQMDVRLFRWNQQKIRIRLCPQGAEIGVQFVEPKIGEIVRMTIAVEVHDHRRVDAHRFQNRLERRHPLEPIGHRLNRVGEMPMRAQRLVSVERSKAIAVRKPEHVHQRGLR
jgi:hypothetical protein